MSDFGRVVDQLRDVVTSASLDRQMPDDDLRDVLSFIVKVNQVVEQVFQDVFALAIDLAYLSPGNDLEGRLYQLQMELELLLARSHYRESVEICSRLKHLKVRFEDHIRPVICNLMSAQDWQQLFWLIEDREGRIISIVERTVGKLNYEIDQARGGDILAVRTAARQLIDELRPLLAELRDLTNCILGLSGRQGFLELTRDRTALRQAVSLVIKQGNIHMSGDIYHTRNAGAVGPNAQATNTNITENYGSLLQGIDLKSLASQLEKLKKEMRVQAEDTKQFEAIAAISSAQDAAQNNEPSTVIEKLKGAGGWALDIATKIGVPIAAEAIKKATGLG